MPCYFHPVGNTGGWLIKPENSDGKIWQLFRLGAGNTMLLVNALPSAETAAERVAKFQTGRTDWDSMPELHPGSAAEVDRQNLHDLNNWERGMAPFLG